MHFIIELELHSTRAFYCPDIIYTGVIRVIALKVNISLLLEPDLMEAPKVTPLVVQILRPEPQPRVLSEAPEILDRLATVLGTVRRRVLTVHKVQGRVCGGQGRVCRGQGRVCGGQGQVCRGQAEVYTAHTRICNHVRLLPDLLSLPMSQGKFLIADLIH